MTTLKELKCRICGETFELGWNDEFDKDMCDFCTELKKDEEEDL